MAEIAPWWSDVWTRHDGVFVRQILALWFWEDDVIPQQPNEYDGADDFARSIDECYRAIRERKAKGGKGWGGWE
jgi:hypothetical protein